MKPNFYLSFALFVAGGLMTACSGDRARELQRQELMDLADSIAAMEKADETAEKARLDSIREAESLKPACFIKRTSSVTYGFREYEDISSNLKDLGFIKKQHKETDWLVIPIPDYENSPYTKGTTIYTRIKNGEETKIEEVIYHVDWGGYGSDEYYVTISFPNEESKNDFIEKVLKMNFVKDIGSKIKIGEGAEWENLFITDSQPLQINLYTVEAQKFHKYNP